MARVLTTNSPDVNPTTDAGNDYLQVQATPADFGGSIGQALQQFGANLDQTGQRFQQSALAAAQLNNESMANDGTTEFSKQTADLAAGFFAKRGKDAVQAYPQFQADVQATHDKIIQQMGNPEAQALAGRVLSWHMNSLMEAGARWQAQQTKVWNIDSATSRADQNVNDAMIYRHDPAHVAALVTVGQGEVLKQAEAAGLDADTTKANQARYAGKAYEQVIAGLIQDGSPIQAQSMFDGVRNSLDSASQIRIAQMLQPAVLDAQATAFFNGLTYKGPAGVPRTVSQGTLWNAVRTQESGGRQFAPDGTPLTSSKGAIGIAQILPGTAQAIAKEIGVPYDAARLKTDATYNEQLGQAYLNQQLTKFGDPTLAVAAYNAGPGVIQNAIENYGDPRAGEISMADFVSHLPAETQKYVNSISANVNGATGVGSFGATGAAPIDPQAFMDRAEQATEGLSTEMRMRVLSKAVSYVRTQNAITAQARSQLNAQLSDLGPRLLAGEPAAIPEAQIRTVYPPAQAQQLISDLKVKADAGQLLKTVQFATPDEVNGMLRDLTAGQGLVTTTLRSKQGFLLGPNGQVAPADQAADLKTRSAVAGLLLQKVQERQKALASDPAQYVLADPNVSADFQHAQQSGDPSAFQAYAAASLAMQQHLGVDDAHAYLLPAQSARSIVAKLTSADPAKTDVGAELDGLAKTYGAYWPRVFGQLVTQEKLPREWQIVAAMDGPGQGAARADMVRAIQASAGKSGAMAQALPKGAAGQIDAALGSDPTLADFTGTASVPGWNANIGLVGNVRQSVKDLAEYYAVQGEPPATAVSKASTAILGAKYDFDGTIRAPKGTLPAVRTEISQIEKTLSVGSLSDKYPSASEIEKARLDDIVTAPKMWLPNQMDDGLIMAYRRNDGSVVPIIGKDNQPIGFRFSQMQSAQPPSLGPGGDVPVDGGLPVGGGG